VSVKKKFLLERMLVLLYQPFLHLCEQARTIIIKILFILLQCVNVYNR